MNFQQSLNPERLPVSVVQLGLIAMAVGFLLLAYSLTVGVFDIVPVFTFDTRLFRLFLFASGLVIFSLGFAASAALLEDRLTTK